MVTFAQKLAKGNVVGAHVGTINLNPDVSYNQYKTFLLTKYIPEINKIFNGDMTMYFAESDRSNGEAHVITIMYVFPSLDARNKYFPTPEKFSDLFTSSVQEKMKPMEDQLTKLGAYSEKFYHDWIVQ
jgi:hypothetical protein